MVAWCIFQITSYLYIKYRNHTFVTNCTTIPTTMHTDHTNNAGNAMASPLIDIPLVEINGSQLREGTDTDEKWCVPINHPILLLKEDATPTIHNLCELIDKTSCMEGLQFTFCPKTFDASSKDGRKLLIESITLSALESGGLQLVVGGGGTTTDIHGCTLSFALKCSCSMPYQSKDNSKFDKENHVIKKQQNRKTTLHNMRSNNRPSSQGGRNASRQTSTKRTLYKGHDKCKFRLPVYTNGKVFFIKGQMGTAWHNNHLQRNPDLAVLCMPTRLMSEEEKGTLKDASDANIGASKAASLILAKHGKYLTRSQAHLIIHPNNSDSNEMSDLKEALMSYNAKCVFLYHSAKQSTSSQLDSEEEEFSNVIIEQTNGCDVAEELAQCENTEGGTGTIPPAIPVPVQNNETMKRTYKKRRLL